MSDRNNAVLIVYLGMMVGAFLWGSLVDQLGCKQCLLTSLSVNSVSAFFSTFMQGYDTILFCRLLSGVGIGSSVPITFSYYLEFLTQEKQGKHLSLVCMLWMINGISATSIPWVIIPPHGSHWTYGGSHGQDHWPDMYPDCGRQSQSPINIETASVRYDASLPPVEPEGYRTPGMEPFTLINNGHTVQMSLPDSMHLRSFPHIYTAIQLHFHWGSQNQDGGSEHQVDGRTFPAEVHVVHFNSEKYANVSEAKHQPDGLAVLGVFLETGDVDNPAYDHILRQLDNIKYAEQETPVRPFDVHELLPVQLGHYYRYNGSLTTPPCYQSVLWTVFHQPVRISAAQLKKLQRTVYSTEEGKSPQVLLADNFRSPQGVNQRVVYSSFPMGTGPSGYSAGETIAIIFGVLLGCLGMFLTGWIVAKRIR